MCERAEKTVFYEGSLLVSPVGAEIEVHEWQGPVDGRMRLIRFRDVSNGIEYAGRAADPNGPRPGSAPLRGVGAGPVRVCAATEVEFRLRLAAADQRA